MAKITIKGDTSGEVDIVAPAVAGTTTYNLSTAGGNILASGDIGTTVQGYDADTAKYDDTTANFTGTLQVSGTAVVKAGDNVSTLTNDSGYITGNETITLSGDVSGSGTTAITTTVANDSHSHTTSTLSGNISAFTNDAGYITSGGKILQVVSTTKTNTYSTTSTSFVDVTGMSVTITPTSTSSKIFIIGTLNMTKDGANNDVIIRLLRGSTHIAYNSGTTNTSHSSFSSGDGAYYGLHSKGIQYLDSPATTSATTYKINIKNVAGTTYLNRRGYNADYGAVSTITAIEVGA